jgi:hypothetical protein
VDSSFCPRHLRARCSPTCFGYLYYRKKGPDMLESPVFLPCPRVLASFSAFLLPRALAAALG